MKKQDIKAQTVAYYDKNAQEWASSHGGYEKESWWKDQMEIFHKYLPKGRVLEIGAGAGKDAESLINLGYDYVGTDASKELLKIAKERNPNAIFLNKSVQELDLTLGEFDGFWASAVLLHIPKDEMVNALKCISLVLRDSGIGFITLKEGRGEEVDEKTGRHYSYFQKEEFEDLLNLANFKVLEGGIIDREGEKWLIFHVKKISK